MPHALSLLVAAFLLSANAVTAQVVYTFTSAGVSGNTGPDQSALDAAYAGTLLDGAVSSIAGVQLWTVPANGYYKIEAFGGQGYGAFGGRGAHITGEFTLSAGDQLKIAVGQQAGPYLDFPAATYNHQFGGGGGSFVTLADNTPLVVAGGGGGNHSSAYSNAIDGQITEAGAAGALGSTLGAGGTAGMGGTQASSADGGAGLLGNGDGIAGGFAFVNGANGGSDEGTGGFGGGGGTSSWNNFRGGGGGGYSGGGGGNNGGTCCAAGGGGGSFNSGLNPVNLAGVQTGNGQVRVTLLSDVVVSADGALIASGSTYNFAQTLLGSQVDTVFTITNYDGAPLNITGPLAVTGANASDFSILSQPDTLVAAAGGSTTFTVRFTPGEASNRSGEISIVSDNVDESPFLLGLSGEGLTISFTGTTVPPGGGGSSATASVNGANCSVSSGNFEALSSVATPPPADLEFANGLLSLSLSNCDVGGTTTVNVDYGTPLPADLQYWKYGPTLDDAAPHWYQIPAQVSGSTISFELVDGGLGDSDLTANGEITDPGGPASLVPQIIPTLSSTALGILSAALALLSLTVLRRRPLEA